jgi:hypothetical protein
MEERNRRDEVAAITRSRQSVGTAYWNGPSRLLCWIVMKESHVTRIHEIHCSGCGKSVPGYDIIHCGSIEHGYRQLCSQCFNQEIAKLDGLEGFEHVNFTPVGLADCTGEIHEFHFRTRLLGPEVALDAFELRDGHPAGYEFQIIADSGEDRLVLLARLIERIRRALSTKHLRNSDLGLQIADQSVRGRIAWDDAREGRLPLMVVDGREVSWEEFGRMLMSFEGFHFQLDIRDKSEEF